MTDQIPVQARSVEPPVLSNQAMGGDEIAFGSGDAVSWNPRSNRLSLVVPEQQQPGSTPSRMAPPPPTPILAGVMELDPHTAQRTAPMSESAAASAREMAATVYRAESRRVFATLIRLLGDFDVAEEALHDAFRAALEQWPRDGVPSNPRAWLVSTGRFKAIDGIRRRARFVALDDVAEQVEAIPDEASTWDEDSIEDDRMRLV